MDLNIKQERLKKKMTLEYVSRYVGVTLSTICDMEKGRCKPSYDVLVKLLKLYNKPYYKDIEELFAVTPDTNTL